jgi:hypothetical protein
VNNKTVYYYLNEKYIDYVGVAGEILFVNCSDCHVSRLFMDNATVCIQMLYSTSITVENSSFTDITSTAIHLDHADNNTIQYNVFLRNNLLDYIFLDFSSCNILQFNIIHGDAAAITLMDNSNHNIFYRNSLISSKVYSMIIDDSNWNAIKQNDIYGCSALKKLFNSSRGGDVLLSRFSFFNKFDGNYWSSWIGNKHKLLRFCPKVIFGVGSAIVNPHFFPIIIGFDWHPAKQSYNISI